MRTWLLVGPLLLCCHSVGPWDTVEANHDDKPAESNHTLRDSNGETELVGTPAYALIMGNSQEQGWLSKKATGISEDHDQIKLLHRSIYLYVQKRHGSNSMHGSS